SIVQEAITRGFECVRRCLRGAELTKPCCDVGRPDVSLAVFVDAPHMLVGGEAETRATWNLFEHAPASTDPERARAADEHVAHLAGARLPGQRHPVPSVLVPAVQIPIDDRPGCALAVFNDCGDRLESLEAGIVALEFSVANSPDACRGQRSHPQAAASCCRTRLTG